ncbi:MAG: hypothetical protein EXX96DRAFT_567722 [Benjaminiella poitrasii]|nr:MAG: hypothetical protein EXX96DRAFT_567722 [Benjaminiella poitrasii]
MSSVLVVKWNDKSFPIEFENSQALEQTSVGELKSYCQRVTGLEPSEMDMYAFGALMSHNELPLNVYGVRSGCNVMLKATKKRHHHASKEKHSKTQHDNDPDNPFRDPSPTIENRISKDEARLLDQLVKIQSKLDSDVAPQVRTYEQNVKTFLNQPIKTDAEKKKQIYMGAYLGEQLMHVLFDLDGFICGPDNLHARQSRKEIVKSAQTLLDKVDEIKAILKNATVVN